MRVLDERYQLLRNLDRVRRMYESVLRSTAKRNKKRRAQ